MRPTKWIWGAVGVLSLWVGGLEAGERPRDAFPRPVRGSGNQQTAEAIAHAIAQAVPEQGYTVEIQYSAGVATLRGAVSNQDQKRRLVQAARGVGPVRDVITRLRLQAVSEAQTVAFHSVEPVETLRRAETVEPSAPNAFARPVPQQAFAAREGYQYDRSFMPNFAWPSFAPYPNYSAVQYPRCYAEHDWPYIGPFHPYPKPPLDWRKVSLNWFAGHWWLKFPQRPIIFRSLRYSY